MHHVSFPLECELNVNMLSFGEEEGQKAIELHTELEAKVIVDP